MKNFKLNLSKKENLYSLWGFVGVMVIGYLVVSFIGPKWSLFFYPDGCLGCQEKWVIQIDQYGSKEECRDAGYDMQNTEVDTFECGYKCEVYDSAGYLCKETIDF